MNVYFTASIVGKKQYDANYRRIVKLLEERGHSVTAHHILDTTEDQLSRETKADRLAFQKKLGRWITSADFMVVETTFPSISVGFEISLAISRGKPVLMLYSEGEPPSLLTHFKDDNLASEHYTTDTLPGIIDDFIAYVRGATDMRFTFFITSQIAAFLETVSRQEKLPKSVYLRRLITEDMQRRQRNT